MNGHDINELFAHWIGAIIMASAAISLPPSLGITNESVDGSVTQIRCGSCSSVCLVNLLVFIEVVRTNTAQNFLFVVEPF